MNFKEWLNSGIIKVLGSVQSTTTSWNNWYFSNGEDFYFIFFNNKFYGAFFKENDNWEYRGFPTIIPKTVKLKLNEVTKYYNQVIKPITKRNLLPYLNDIKALCQNEDKLSISALADLMEENGFVEYSKILRDDKHADIPEALQYNMHDLINPALTAFRYVRSLL